MGHHLVWYHMIMIMSHVHPTESNEDEDVGLRVVWCPLADDIWAAAMRGLVCAFAVLLAVLCQVGEKKSSVASLMGKTWVHRNLNSMSFPERVLQYGWPESPFEEIANIYCIYIYIHINVYIYVYQHIITFDIFWTVYVYCGKIITQQASVTFRMRVWRCVNLFSALADLPESN